MKQDEGSILSSILPAIAKIASKTMPVLSKTVLPSLAKGVSGALGSLGIDALFGNGLIDENLRNIIVVIAKLSDEINKLSNNDKLTIDQIMMSGNSQMTGGFLGTLLASIGIPMILNALTGQGLHNTPTVGYKHTGRKFPYLILNNLLLNNLKALL